MEWPLLLGEGSNNGREITDSSWSVRWRQQWAESKQLTASRQQAAGHQSLLKWYNQVGRECVEECGVRCPDWSAVWQDWQVTNWLRVKLAANITTSPPPPFQHWEMMSQTRVYSIKLVIVRELIIKQLRTILWAVMSPRVWDWPGHCHHHCVDDDPLSGQFCL